MLAIGTQVRVHQNLNLTRKHGRAVWSITVQGKVVAHCDTITIADVTFKVSEATRRRVVRAHCREVHAWCIGTIAAPLPADMPRVPITYNPYRSGSFTRRDTGAALVACAYVEFGSEAVAAGAIV
jgi:hypothetical protein